MAVFHVFLLVLVIGMVHHSHGRTYESESIPINGTDTSPVKAPGDTSYDYFSLAMQWPKSFCNRVGITCISPIPKHFTVHGLWPQLYSGPITNCISATTSTYTGVDSIVMKFMNDYWPDLNARNKKGWLWDHEYQRHGSCFLPFQAQSSLYFRNTYDMAKQILDVNDMLSNPGLGGIKPDDGKYQLTAFENAIFGYLKFIPWLRCNNAGGSGNQLHEIRFCFNKNGALRNCSSTFGDFGSSNCGVQPDPLVMFPRP